MRKRYLLRNAQSWRSPSGLLMTFGEPLLLKHRWRWVIEGYGLWATGKGFDSLEKHTSYFAKELRDIGKFASATELERLVAEMGQN